MGQEWKLVQLLGRSTRIPGLAARCEGPLEGAGATIPGQTQVEDVSSSWILPETNGGGRALLCSAKPCMHHPQWEAVG